MHFKKLPLEGDNSVSQSLCRWASTGMLHTVKSPGPWDIMWLFESIWLLFHLFCHPPPLLCQRRHISQTYSPHPARCSFIKSWLLFLLFLLISSPLPLQTLDVFFPFSSDLCILYIYVLTVTAGSRDRSILTKHPFSRCLQSTGEIDLQSGHILSLSLFFFLLEFALLWVRENQGITDSSIPVIKRVGWNCILVGSGYIQSMSLEKHLMEKQRTSWCETFYKTSYLFIWTAG